MQWATVFENVWLPLRLKGTSRTAARDQVEEALDMVGSEGLRRLLSAGTVRRHEDARVDRPGAGHPAELLLMDEPFAALDEITRFKLNNDLLHLWETFNWTVIFVTHSVFESAYLSSRIVVMAARPGRVVEDIER